MVVGDRFNGTQYQKENKRPFHTIGNKVLTQIVNFVFSAQLNDILSGLRVFN